MTLSLNSNEGKWSPSLIFWTVFGPPVDGRFWCSVDVPTLASVSIMLTLLESAAKAILSDVASVLIAAPTRFSAIESVSITAMAGVSVSVSITAMAGVSVSPSVSLSKYTN